MSPQSEQPERKLESSTSESLAIFVNSFAIRIEQQRVFAGSVARLNPSPCPAPVFSLRAAPVAGFTLQFQNSVQLFGDRAQLEFGRGGIVANAEQGLGRSRLLLILGRFSNLFVIAAKRFAEQPLQRRVIADITTSSDLGLCRRWWNFRTRGEVRRQWIAGFVSSILADHQVIIQDAQFVRSLGIELTSLGKGWCETRVNVSPVLQQQHGFVHAGVLMTIVARADG
jgi:hypothetical protein